MSEFESPGTDIEGQVVVVVGGTRGIGAAIATDLAAEGARIVLAGRDVTGGANVAERISGRGGRASVVGCDVTNNAECEALFRVVADHHGRVDTVFANQGVAGPSARLTAWSDEAVAQSLAVNLVGCLHIARAAEDLLGADGGGRLIVTGSGSGHHNMIGLGMYGISKAAVSHLVRQLAVEWRSRSIAVNELVPGPVRTAMTGFEAGKPADPEAGPSPMEEYVASMGEWLKEPEDVTRWPASCAAFRPAVRQARCSVWQGESEAGQSLVRSRGLVRPWVAAVTRAAGRRVRLGDTTQPNSAHFLLGEQ